MKIVIELSEHEYEGTLQNAWSHWFYLNKIKNGTILPKGHGRLIDADMVAGDIDTERVNLLMDGLKGTPRGREHLNDLRRIMDEIPTIIEADSDKDNPNQK